MDFSDPHFAAPVRLWGLLPAALILAGLALHALKARRVALDSVASPAMLGRLLSGHSPAMRAVKTALFATAAALVVVAVSRPCWGVTVESRPGQSEDVIFLLDTSRSMTARDVEPYRLERAKRAIATFVGAHPAGRVGLVAFAGEAFLQCPPTSDRDIFNETLDSLDTNVIPTPGTDIGAALEEGNAAFGDKKGRRTLVLLTDGEDLESRGVETANKLGREGVVVHAVGIGGATGFDIAKSADGTGGTVTTRLDEATLKAVAAATGGEYFRLGGPKDNFEPVELRLERAAGADNGSREAIERFPIPLAVAALLLAIEALLGTRRRTNFAGLAKVAVMPLLLLLVTGAARAETPAELYDAGSDALRRGEFTEAEGTLKAALPEAGPTLRPLALHNLGQARARGAVKVLDKRSAEGDPAARLDAATKDSAGKLAPVEKALFDHTIGKFDQKTASQAYGEGRASRKELLKTIKAVAPALVSGNEAAAALERARNDFLGANELNPADVDAKTNADAIARYLEKLRRDLAKEEKAMNDARETSAKLGAKLRELKKLLKNDSGQGQSQDEDDDEDEKDDKDKKDGDKQNQPKQGKEDNRTESERRRDEGREGRMTKEEAAAALQSLSGEMRRRVTFGQSPGQGEPRDTSNGKDR